MLFVILDQFEIESIRFNNLNCHQAVFANKLISYHIMDLVLILKMNGGFQAKYIVFRFFALHVYLIKRILVVYCSVFIYILLWLYD